MLYSYSAKCGVELLVIQAQQLLLTIDRQGLELAVLLNFHSLLAILNDSTDRTHVQNVTKRGQSHSIAERARAGTQLTKVWSTVSHRVL